MTVSKTVGAALLGGTKEFSDQEWETLPVGKYTAAIEWLADKTNATVASANVIAYMPSKEKLMSTYSSRVTMTTKALKTV